MPGVVKSLTCADGRVTAAAGGLVGVADLSATGTPSGSNFLRGDGTWATPAGSGTVTSVGLSLPSIFSVTGSPVTDSGTLTAALAAQSANTIFAGPTSGGAAAPAFRALVTADLPNDVVTYAKIQNLTSGKLLGRSTAGAGDCEELTVGTGLSLSAGTLTASGGGPAAATVTLAVGGGSTASDVNPGTGPFTSLRLNTTVNIDVSGFVAGSAGEWGVLINITASRTITLKHEHADSSAANRLLLPGAADLALAPGEAAAYSCDATTQRRRCWKL